MPGRTLAALGLVMLAAVWLRAAALSSPFFADDYLFLDQVRGRSLPAAMSGPDPIGNYLRPVSRALWFWSVSSAGGESPRAFHIANLGLLVAILGLTFRIARRMLPARAALAGTALLALHHAADVPVLWASGSQDLLAVLGALGAIELHAAGHSTRATAALLLALFSKETVVLAPLVAVAVARPPRTPWVPALRRAWPLFAASLGWAATWLAAAGRRPALGGELHLDPASLPAALIHALQTATGIEWTPAGLATAFQAPPPPALLAALVGVALVAFGKRVSTAGAKPGSLAGPWPALAAGAIWTLAGALPVTPVAETWSAYYYLFSSCGVALVAGALVARRSAWVALLPVLVVGYTSENARRLPEFATARGLWTTQSHINQHYLLRGMTMAQRCLDDLRRARPELPGTTTLYFSGLPAAVAFQTADGPLVRWAYRDTSLRSYFLSGFRLEQAERGPLIFFQTQNDSLVEITGRDSLERLGLSLILGGAETPARDMLTIAWRANPSIQSAYRLAFVEAARGDIQAARGWLTHARVEPIEGPTPEVLVAFRLVTAGDTTGAIELMVGAVQRHGLDTGAHALLADLLLAAGDLERGTIEAYAARALAPEEASTWRRWGMVEAAHGRASEAAKALERYQFLAGEAARGDTQVEDVLRELRRQLPGGDLARQGLRRLER
jgi:hypothetical protein